jgi:hypothetical protein
VRAADCNDRLGLSGTKVTLETGATMMVGLLKVIFCGIHLLFCQGSQFIVLPVAAPTSASAKSDGSFMNTVHSRAAGVRALAFLVLCTIVGSYRAAFAQTNSWTNSVSGNWQDDYWTLGLPTTNQDVSLTNAGWKALAIGPATVQNFPETLTLNSLTISSPSNSYNTLLMNFAGTNTPLVVRSMSVASNSAVTMLSSALLLDGSNGIGLQLGGEFNQNDSIVSGQQVNVGYIGPGVYNFNSGFFGVSNLRVGSAFSGVFNQNGGTNLALITDVEGGEYIQNDGYFGGTIYFTQNGTFRQRGGVLNTPVSITYGNYFLEGGINYGGVSFPYTSTSIGLGQVIQSGGTNFGGINLGGFYGTGQYTMSNGVSYGAISVGARASFSQLGGVQICGTQGVLVGADIISDRFGGTGFIEGTLEKQAGMLSCVGMSIAGHCYLWGGTNLISGAIIVSGPHSSFVSGGFLCASNFFAGSSPAFGTVSPAYVSGMTFITNQLEVSGGSYSSGFSGSGDLTVSNIVVTGSTFSFSGHSLNQSGILSLTNGNLNFSGLGSFRLGQLQINSSGNSILGFSSGQCVLRFMSSSGSVWSNAAVLNVQNWSGSLYGGGAHQIIFGTNAAALTPQQLTQIQFQNPAGLAPGNYPARILATGEIVPDTGAPLPPMLNLNCASNGLMHLSLGGDIGRSYAFEISTDLAHWNTWTDQFNTSGTMSLDDADSTNCPQRFYRAHLMP